MDGITLLGIGALGINFPGLVAQFINFGILLVVLRLVAYKPVMRMLDERAARVRESIETAERIKERESDTARQGEGGLAEAPLGGADGEPRELAS